MAKLKAHKLTAEIKRLQSELVEHQNKGKHPKAVKIPKSNTGNYDSSVDSYWLECSCETCLKKLTEDQ